MFLGISLLILGCLTIAATPGGNRTIRAKEFILEDANGKTRASLNMLENLPRLCLTDENGDIRAAFAMTKAGSTLVLRDERGELRAMLLVTQKGPVLNLRDANGNPCATLGADKNGSGMLLYDGNGKRRFVLATKEQVMLGMFDANGKVIWKAP